MKQKDRATFVSPTVVFMRMCVRECVLCVGPFIGLKSRFGCEDSAGEGSEFDDSSHPASATQPPVHWGG